MADSGDLQENLKHLKKEYDEDNGNSDNESETVEDVLKQENGNFGEEDVLSDNESETVEEVVFGSLEEPGNYGEENENSEEEFEERPFQELSIQWLNMHKIKKLLPEDNQTSGTEPDRWGALIRKIVEDYNQKEEKSKWARKYEEENTWDEPEYFMKSFSCTNYSRPRIDRALAKTPHLKTNTCYIVFYYRKNDAGVQMITASSGKAWFVARPFVDYAFPFKIAKKVADFDQIIWLERRHFVGERLKEAVMRPSRLELYKTANLYYIIDHFVCKMRKDSKLFELCDEKDVTIKFTTSGLLRINKKMTREEYFPIIELFEEYMKQETSKEMDPASEFLFLLQPARFYKGHLDKLLAQTIFDDYQQGQKLLFHVQHKYLQDFLMANDIEVKIASSTRFQPLEKSPPDIEDIITAIEAENKETFVDKILGSKLRYTDRNSVQQVEALIDCIEGELRISDLETQGGHIPAPKTYFKIRKVWYEIRAEYLSLLHEDFRSVLKRALIKDVNDEGQLQRFWVKNDESKGQITQELLKNKLKLDEKEASELLYRLKKLEVQYISSKKYATQKKLVGEILTNAKIEEYRDVIEQTLESESWFGLESKINEWCKKDSKTVMAALEKERRVLKKIKPRIYVSNPFPYQLKERPYYDKLSTLLLGLYESRKGEEDAFEKQPKDSRKNKNTSIGEITQQVLQDKLELLEDEASKLMSELEKMKVRYVSTEYFVEQPNLLGEILKTAAIERHRQPIEQILCDPENLSDLKSKIHDVCKKDTKDILEALEKKRCVLKSVNKKVEGKTKQLTFVINPFPYQLNDGIFGKYNELSQLLIDTYVHYLKEEETYNRQYVEDTDNDYMVFDQITPLHIEPCDILKYTSDTVYIYHVKATFGQPTREVCSQILNSAILFRNALSMHQSKNFLENLYETCIKRNTTGDSWFKKVQNKMILLGKDGFIDIFRNRKIVFVYAYLPNEGKSFSEEIGRSSFITGSMLGSGDEHLGVRRWKLLERLKYLDPAGRLTNKFHSLTSLDFQNAFRHETNLPDKDVGEIHKELIKAKPSSESTLAKMEVVRLAQNLASLGFDFKICEIPRKL